MPCAGHLLQAFTTSSKSCLLQPPHHVGLLLHGRWCRGGPQHSHGQAVLLSTVSVPSQRPQNMVEGQTNNLQAGWGYGRVSVAAPTCIRACACAGAPAPAPTSHCIMAVTPLQLSPAAPWPPPAPQLLVPYHFRAHLPTASSASASSAASALSMASTYKGSHSTSSTSTAAPGTVCLHTPGQECAAIATSSTACSVRAAPQSDAQQNARRSSRRCSR